MTDKGLGEKEVGGIGKVGDYVKATCISDVEQLQNSEEVFRPGVTSLLGCLCIQRERMKTVSPISNWKDEMFYILWASYFHLDQARGKICHNQNFI